MSCFKVTPRAGKAFMLSRVRWAWARSCRSKPKFVGSAPGVVRNWCAAEKGDVRLLPLSSSNKVRAAGIFAAWILALSASLCRKERGSAMRPRFEKKFARGVP